VSGLGALPGWVQSRKSARLNDMSVLPSTAEVVEPPRHVRFAPEANLTRTHSISSSDTSCRCCSALSVPKPGRFNHLAPMCLQRLQGLFEDVAYSEFAS
jgi:hypothetical protein